MAALTLAYASPARAEERPAAETTRTEQSSASSRAPVPSDAPATHETTTSGEASTSSGATASDEAPPGDRRDPAYYRGRREPRPPAEALLWVPRVLFFPLWVVTEYGIRVPTRSLIRWAETSHALGYLGVAFHPVPDFYWYPTAVIDLGVLPSVGVHARWTHAGLRTNELRLTASTGGLDFWLIDLQDRLRIDSFTFGLRGGYLTRPDRPFYGIGPYSRAQDETRYRLTRGEVAAFAIWDPSTHVSLAMSGMYRNETTGDGWSPTISSRFQLPDAAPGFGHLQLFLVDARFALDSRHDRLGVSGVRLDLHGVWAIDPLNRERQFVQGEAELQGAIEVIRPNRALVGSVYVADTQPLGTEPVPFTHLVALGRDRHEGYLYGRFLGESATLATLAWRWPVWDQIDMFVQGSVGNVWGRHFEGFDVRAMTASLGLGLRTRIDNAAAFRLIVAAGSTRFDEPFGIEGIRFYASVSPGL